MSRFLISRLALAVLLAATLLSTAALAQSQDTQSVADAARRASRDRNPGISQCRSRHSLACVECFFNCSSRKRPCRWLSLCARR